MAKAGDVIKTPMFWMFGLGLFFAAHTLTGIQQHLALYMTGHGVTPTNAAFALSMLLGASADRQDRRGAIADKYSSRVSLLWSIVCLAAGIGGLLAVEPDRRWFTGRRRCSAWDTAACSTLRRSSPSNILERSESARSRDCS